MRNSAIWLSSVVQVKRIHRRDTRSIVSVRNLDARSSSPVTGGLRNTRLTAEITRPIPFPTRRASASLLNTAASSTTAPASTASPIRAAETNPALFFPESTRNTTEITGRASFMKMFQMPLTPTYRATAVPVNPQECRIEYVSPIAIAPPPGSVLATDVVVCVTTAAGQRRRPGSAAMFAHQYVKRLKIVAAISEPISRG
jgi:hypothetical protein